jgi:hypothetical protein
MEPRKSWRLASTAYRSFGRFAANFIDISTPQPGKVVKPYALY